MFRYPPMCMSATSLGRVLVIRYSLRMLLPTAMATESSPAGALSVSISCTSYAGMPSRVILCRYSSCPDSSNTALTISRISGPVRWSAWYLRMRFSTSTVTRSAMSIGRRPSRTSDCNILSELNSSMAMLDVRTYIWPLSTTERSSTCFIMLSTILPRLVMVYCFSFLLAYTSECLRSCRRWYANLPLSFLVRYPTIPFSSE